MATIQGFTYFPDLPVLVPICSKWDVFGDNQSTISIFPQLGGAFRSHLMNGIEEYTNDPLTGISPADAFAGAVEYHQLLTDFYNKLGSGTGGGEANNGISGWYWYLATQASWFFGASTNASCNRNRGENMEAHAETNVSRAFYSEELNISATFGQVLLDLESDVLTIVEAENEIAELELTHTELSVDIAKATKKLQESKLARYVEITAIGGAILILLYYGFTKLKK